MELSPTTQKYILHWGEMGTRWGVNRTVAQIHALLFLANAPLTAEDIAASLNVARSNVSNSLKELQSWGLARITHVMGDRRDHFVALQDVWEIFRVIMEERKRRETHPDGAARMRDRGRAGCGDTAGNAGAHGRSAGLPGNAQQHLQRL